MTQNEIRTENDIEWWRFHRRLYEWTLSWAESTYGSIALFLVAFSGASWFPLPAEILLVPMILGDREKARTFFVLATVGSVLGALFGFGLGYFAWDVIEPYFFDWFVRESQFEYVQSLYDKNLFYIVFAAALSPIPFKVFTLSSGVFASGLNEFQFSGFLSIFILAAVIGRTVRFGIISFLLWYFGEPVRAFIDRYFDMILIAILLLIVLIWLMARFVR